MIEIRTMTNQDIDKILELEKTCFTADAWAKEDFEYRFDSDDFVNLVCECDGTFAGYITACSVLDELNIDSVAILPEFRRMGLARRLINETVSRKKPSSVFLEVRQSNLGAIALYESLGFEKVGLRKNYYQQPVENAILMTLSIENLQ